MTTLKKLALVAALAVSAAPAFAANDYVQTSSSAAMSRAMHHHAKRAVREDNAYDAQAYEPAQATGPGIDLSILSQH